MNRLKIYIDKIKMMLVGETQIKSLNVDDLYWVTMTHI